MSCKVRSMDDPAEAAGPPRTPRWVKISGIVAVVLAALVAVVFATGGPGEHGPGRHSGGDDRSPPATVPEGHEPPPGHPPPE